MHHSGVRTGGQQPPPPNIISGGGWGGGGGGGNASPIFQCTPLSLPHFTILPYVSHVPLEKIVYNMTLLNVNKILAWLFIYFFLYFCALYIVL